MIIINCRNPFLFWCYNYNKFMSHIIEIKELTWNAHVYSIEIFKAWIIFQLNIWIKTCNENRLKIVHSIIQRTLLKDYFSIYIKLNKQTTNKSFSLQLTYIDYFHQIFSYSDVSKNPTNNVTKYLINEIILCNRPSTSCSFHLHITNWI